MKKFYFLLIGLLISIGSVATNIQGTFTVGVSGTYQTITAAITALNNATMTGPVTFLLMDSNYPSETCPIVINQNAGSSATNILTIKPNLNNEAITLTKSVANGPIFKILNNYTILNGHCDNCEGGINWTITNSSTTAPNVILIGSTGTASIVGVTVENCTLINGVNTANAVVISDAATSGNAGYFNNITIQGNDIEKAYCGIYANAAVSSTNGDGLLISSNSMKTSGVNSIRYCGIHLIGVSGATISGVTVSGNTIENIYDNNAVAENPKGIWLDVGCNNVTLSGNTIDAMTLTHSGADSLAAIMIQGVTNLSCTGNTITNLTTTIATGLISGIYICGASTGLVFSKNYISCIKNLKSSGYSSQGLYLGSTSTSANITVLNNFIWDIASYGAASLSAGNGYGINIAAGGGYSLFANSIYLDTVQLHSTGNPACLLINSGLTGPFDIRDNIFSITASVGTGRYCVICNSANSVFSNIDYNDYYSSKYIGYIGGNKTTLADWKAGTGQDVHSIQGDPHFSSPTNPCDLHIGTDIVSPVSNAGVQIAAVTDDIDGDVRNNPPDIGADEFNFVQIDYFMLGDVLPCVTQTLSATITDAVYDINVTSGTKPRIWYKKTTNSNTLPSTNNNTTDGWKYVEASNSSSPFSFTINYSLIYGGTTGGDVIQYFVVAQDVQTYPAVGINSGTFSVTPTSVALSDNNVFPIIGSINSFTILNQLNSNVTIGVSGTYTSLTGATGSLFAAINAGGITANITATLLDASIAESGATALNAVTNCGTPYTLTIRPANGVTCTLTGSVSNGPLINLNASNVIIDGSNSGGTDRHLTITNTSTTSPKVILIGSSGTTPVTNVTLKNAILINGANNGDAVVISDEATPGNAGYFNNITVQNNSIQKAFNGINANAVVSSTNGSGLLITGNDMTTSGTNSIRDCGVHVTGANGVTVSNNLIGNIVDANAESLRGIWVDAGCNNATISGNTLTSLSLSNTGDCVVTGISVTSPTATSISVTGNAISTLSNNGTNQGSDKYFCGIYSTSSHINITNNTISGLTQNGLQTSAGIFLHGGSNQSCTGNTISNLTATAAEADGIMIWSCTTGLFSKNQVFNINCLSSSGPISTGIILLESNGITLMNNFIYGITNYGSVNIGSGNGYGIFLGSGGPYNLYANSINLASNQTLSTGLPACLYISSTGSLDIRDNIFSIPATVGSNRYAVLCQSPNTVFSNIDYNVYNSSGSNIGYIGGSNRADIAAWRIGTGKDVNSIQGDPQYVSATDLHIQTLIVSPASNTGVQIGAVTDDIDGDARNNPPDIGADEFNGLDAPIIQYTTLQDAFSCENQTLSATITDANGINVTSGTKPRIWFKKLSNSNALPATNDNTTDGWKYVEASNSASPFSFTINNVLIYGGVSSGDVIQYFVVAQNLGSSPMVNINSGTFSNTPSSVALAANVFPITGTINSFNILNSINNNVTIGASGTYTSLTGSNGLFAAINAGGITASITASLLDANISETGVTALNTIRTGCSSQNTLTIKPANGVSCTLTGSVANGPLINLNGASNVIIDGSNSGGTDNHLTITNTSTTAPNVILIGSSGTTPVTNVTLKNAILVNGDNSSNAVVISDAGSPGGPGYFNNITVQNNSIQKSFNGIYANAVVSSTNGSGLLITGNDMTTSGANSIRYCGVHITGVNGVTISNNQIENIVDANQESPRGIWVDAGCDNVTVSGNTISSLSSTYVGDNVVTGIVIGAGASTSISVINNTISSLSNNGTSSGTDKWFSGIYCTSSNTSLTNNTITGLTQSGIQTCAGIFLEASFLNCTGNTISGIISSTMGEPDGIMLWNCDSVLISKNQISTIKSTFPGNGPPANGIVLMCDYWKNITITNNFIFDITAYGTEGNYHNGNGIIVVGAGPYAIYGNSINMATNQTVGMPACLTLLGDSYVYLKDNIFSITGTAGVNRYAIVNENPNGNSAFFSIDNNIYYSSGPNICRMGSTDYADLAAWRVGTGQDVHSLQGDPKYVSDTDLHIQPAGASPASNSGIQLAAVTDDIDGDTRNNPPDIGADEFSALLVWTGVVSTDWNTAGNWLSNSVPMSSDDVTISSGPTNMPVVNENPGTPAKCRNLTLNTGTSLKIASGKALTVTGPITNNVGSAGFIIKSDASGTGSLIDNGTITGAATVERYLPFDAWHYVSMPISNGVSQIFLNDYLKTSDPTTTSGWSDYILPTNTLLPIMRGYACWKPSTNPVLDTCSGNLNTGNNLSISLNRTDTDPWAGWHLVGNPYPSGIDLTLSGILWGNIEHAAWFWSEGAGNYLPVTISNGTYSGTHDSFVPPTQGFFVHILDTYSGTTTLTMNNSLRVHTTETFLKNTSAVEDFLMLTVKGSVNFYYDKLSVQFNPNTTIGYDPGHDAYKLAGLDKAPQIYTRIGDTNVTCNSLPFTSKYMVIPMSFKCSLTGTYTITADSLGTFGNSISVYLEDTKLSTTHNLKSEPVYTFNYTAGEDANRFLLHFTNEAFGIPTLNSIEAVKIYSFDKSIYISSANKDPYEGKVVIYDLVGRELYNGSYTNIGLTVIKTVLPEGYYVVRVITPEGVFNKKVYLR
jgi:hypothetical protein